MPTSNDVESRTYPIRPAASSRCRNDEHERLLVSVGLAPVCIPVHVQQDLETGFTRQPIRWRRDGPMTTIVVYCFFVRLVWCPWASPSMFRRIPHRLHSTTGRPVARCPNKEIIVLAVSVGIAPVGISVMCMDVKFGSSRSPIGRRRDAQLTNLIVS